MADAISSSGGATPVVQPGAMSATGASTTDLTTSGSVSVSTETGADGRPAGLPEGFASWDELVTEYNKASSEGRAFEIGAGGQAQTAASDKPALLAEDGSAATKVEGKEEAAKTEEPTKKEGVRPVEEIKANLAKAGGIYADPRYEAAAIEFEQTGALTPETLKATAEKFGVPEQFVQQFMDLHKATTEMSTETATKAAQAEQDAHVTDLHTVAGGAENFKAFQEWADAGGVSEADQKVFNALLDTNPAGAKMALQTLVAAWKADGGGAPPRDITLGGPSGGLAAAVPGYASSAEMQAAMNDPRYRTDEAYRQQVAAKVATSKF